MRPKIVLIGGGGHCRSCIDVIIAHGKFDIHGVLDPHLDASMTVVGYPILGNDEKIRSIIDEGVSFFLVTVGQIETAEVRMRCYSRIVTYGGKLATIVSPEAYVPTRISIGEGSIIMHRAILNVNCTIGVNTIINTGSLLEHDVYVGDHCHISTCAVINGGAKVGDKVFVGSNAVINNDVLICDGAVIGAGAVVVTNIVEPGTYAGNPARRIK